jgi:hypothetical protein
MRRKTIWRPGRDAVLSVLPRAIQDGEDAIPTSSVERVELFHSSSFLGKEDE